MKILVVDDEEEIGEIIVRILSGSGLAKEGDIFYADRGAKAITLYEQHEPELLITDMNMPQMNGIELVEKLRAKKEDIEVVIVTGQDYESSIYIRLGVVEVLRKPFKRDELLLSVRKVIEKIELKKKNTEIQQELMRAEKLSSLGLMAAGVAHEINNPTAFIKGNLQFVLKNKKLLQDLLADKLKADGNAEAVLTVIEKQKELFVEDRDAIKSALVGCDRIAKIVANLLSFSRASSNKKEAISLQKILESAISLTQYHVKYHKIKVDLDPNLKDLEVNYQEITQVFMNLIVNSIDAIEEKYKGKNSEELGLVSIAAVDDVFDNRKIITFSDNGNGMSEAVRENLFTPFFTTKPEGNGAGLGLSICKSNIESNGGSVTCRSDLGEGTVFTICLPLVPVGTS